jgi:hypothetical protein
MMKPFSQDLFDADDNAKHLVIDYLQTQGLDLVVNPDQYGIDLIGGLNGELRAYEVEVKHSWSGPDFGYDTVHIPARKIKFALRFSRFFILNHERTHAILIKGQDVAESPIISKKTIYTESEDFIEVSLNKASIIKL